MARAHRRFHGVNRAGQVALQPTHLRHATERLRSRTQIHHPLQHLDRFAEFALLHQRIAQERQIHREAALGDQSARQRFGLSKSMQVMPRMSAQEPRFRARSETRVHHVRRFFREFVEPGIECPPRLRHERPPESLKRLGLGSGCRRARLP